jgi:hypothetical protein
VKFLEKTVVFTEKQQQALLHDNNGWVRLWLFVTQDALTTCEYDTVVLAQ